MAFITDQCPRLCYTGFMKNEARQIKDRKRWAKNKAEKRARDKAAMPLVEISDEFLSKVDDERKKRGSLSAYKWAWENPILNYWSASGNPYWIRKRYGHWHKFVADVWAATVEIDAKMDSQKATPTRIARLLAQKDQLHDYTVNSARIRIYTARETIAAFEKAAAEDPEAQFWLPFNETQAG